MTERERERIDVVLNRLATYRFRASFHLRRQERAQVSARGMAVVRLHAAEIIRTRLATAAPENDGKQTPWGGHPVFRAQHGTGTCCRGCLRRLHGIPQGRVLTEEEQTWIVEMLAAWVEREMVHPVDGPPARVPPRRSAGSATLF